LKSPISTNIGVGLTIQFSTQRCCECDYKDAGTLPSITYHNADGQMEKEILEAPLKLSPLASRGRFEQKGLAIPQGMSSCMVVEWEASQKVSPVLVEGVLIGSGTGWTSGLVFKGVVVAEKE
jgi:hypothetical protein